MVFTSPDQVITNEVMGSRVKHILGSPRFQLLHIPADKYIISHGLSQALQLFPAMPGGKRFFAGLSGA